jgi:hypothetical protein
MLRLSVSEEVVCRGEYVVRSKIRVGKGKGKEGKLRVKIIVTLPHPYCLLTLLTLYHPVTLPHLRTQPDTYFSFGVRLRPRCG